MQEDAHLAILNFDGHSDRALFGVFDGHSGSSVAKFCAKYFPALLLDSAEYKAGDYKAAMHSIYLEIDQMLQRPEHFEELREMSKKPQSGDSELEGELSPLQLAQQGMLTKPGVHSPLSELLCCIIHGPLHILFNTLSAFVSFPSIDYDL